jgi:hypothetical protein
MSSYNINHTIFFAQIFCPLHNHELYLVSLPLLGETCIIYAVGPKFEPQSSHLFSLRIKFLITRLFDKKKTYQTQDI